MIVINTIKEMQEFSTNCRIQNKRIGFVPTMGYLHQGHATLIKESSNNNDVTIVSIFVNPKQFAPNEDLSRYPRDFERDSLIAEQNNCDVIFFPDVDEMYSALNATFVSTTSVTTKFEGRFRPEHFNGVSTVVAKLFNACLPDVAYFGQKDFQQTLVIKRLVEDLNFPIEIKIVPTVREQSGLALSSRNVYLSNEEKEQALTLYKALSSAKSLIQSGEVHRSTINQTMVDILSTIPNTTIDYACAAVASTLDEPDSFSPTQEIVLLIACRVGSTRLIDNMLVTA